MSRNLVPKFRDVGSWREKSHGPSPASRALEMATLSAQLFDGPSGPTTRLSEPLVFSFFWVRLVLTRFCQQKHHHKEAQAFVGLAFGNPSGLITEPLEAGRAQAKASSHGPSEM